MRPKTHLIDFGGQPAMSQLMQASCQQSIIAGGALPPLHALLWSCRTACCIVALEPLCMSICIGERKMMDACSLQSCSSRIA